MMTKLEKLLRRELYKKDFYEFVKYFWDTCDPKKLIDGKLIQIYCELFQYVCRQWVDYKPKEIVLPSFDKNDVVIDLRHIKQKININVPPRHSKSMIFNVLGPTWLWLNEPIKAVSISHTQGLATDMNEKRQAILNSEKFKELFDDIYLTSNSKSELKDNRGGELYSLNRNAFTGYGGDVIINDDLTNAETARKDKEEMNNAWAYFQNTMPSRINDISKSIIMNIQQRLAPNDITGHIMNDKKLSDEYFFLILPAIFQKRTYIILPISGEVIKFEKGDYLWPERFGNYESLKNQVGSTIFETQYLQNPIASDKTIIKEDMIIEKNENEVPSIDYADMIYTSHDFPVKDKESSDYLGSVLAYRIGSKLYFIDALEKRMAFKKSLNYVRALEDNYPGIIQVIEDKANGSPIIEQAQDEVSGIQAFQPGTQSKIQRLESASIYISNVIFVRNIYDKFTNSYRLNEGLEILKRKLLSFPYVDHDDVIDAFSQLLLFVYKDRRYMVYGKSFNDDNIVNVSDLKNISYSTIFFNREGDIWKVLEIGAIYGVQTILVCKKEQQFKASIIEGFEKLKEFGNFKKNVFIDCSATDGLRGMTHKGISIERYEINDFDMSVGQLNLAFAANKILLDKSCKKTKMDIENFKFSKSKDENSKYLTEKDGFISCMRIALKYYGGIV